MNTLFLTFLFVYIPIYTTACDITATLTSQTHQEIFAQFTFHNKTKSPIYQFEQDGQVEKVHITGMLCSINPTRLDVYSKPPVAGTKPNGTSQAFLEGFGYVNYVLLSDGAFMGMKAGIVCAAGDCGASRG
uniref:NTR domain-containing protein n=1 Tax=Caenorhabditis tropicalis TaxID=1561998 RepID=A0A1I7V4N6_9PELO